MRIQFVPLPRMNPFHPSSRHIFTRAFHIDNLYSSLPALWTWSKIFKRSRGDTIVLETAPATPPAMNAATTGSAILLLILKEGVFSEWVSWKAVSVDVFKLRGEGHKERHGHKYYYLRCRRLWPRELWQWVSVCIFNVIILSRLGAV